MYYLVKYNAACDYNFTVNGFAIVSINMWTKIIENIENIKQAFEIKLGPNQKVYYEDGIDLLQDFDIEEVSFIEAFIIIDKLIDAEYIENPKTLLNKEFLVESGIFPDLYKLISITSK